MRRLRLKSAFEKLILPSHRSEGDGLDLPSLAAKIIAKYRFDQQDNGR
jgi:hypothetical protein